MRAVDGVVSSSGDLRRSVGIGVRHTSKRTRTTATRLVPNSAASNPAPPIRFTRPKSDTLIAKPPVRKRVQPQLPTPTSPLAADDTQPATDKEIIELTRAGRIGEAAYHVKRRLDDNDPAGSAASTPVIIGLVKANRYPLAWSIFSDSKRVRAKINYGGLHYLILGAAKANRCHEALKVLHHMREAKMSPNEPTLVILIHALLKSNRRGTPFLRMATQLWQLLWSSQDPAQPRNAFVYTAGLRVHTCMGRFREADALLEQMAAEGHPLTPVQYNIIMQAHCKRNDAAAVRRLFRRMKDEGLAPDTTTYNIFMHCFVRRGELLRAKAVLDKAVREGVQLCIRSYTVYMRGLCQVGDVAAAEKVLAAVREAGLKPTVVTYGVLIQGYIKVGRISDAERLMDEMRQRGPMPNTIIFNTLIAAHVNTLTTPGFTSALRLIRSMAALGVVPEADTYNIVMDGLVRLPDLPGAARVFSQLAEMDVPIDATVYTTLMKMFKITGEVDSALKVFAELRSSADAHADPKAWNALADVLACYGRMDEAERAARQGVMEDAARGLPVPVEGFGALINGFHRINQMEAAVACLRRFLQVGGQPDKRMYDQVIDLCLRNGDLKTAFQVVRAMELASVPVDKEQYKAWFDKYQRLDASGQAAGGPLGRGFSDGYNVYLERFKFWLGLPNQYYDGGWP